VRAGLERSENFHHGIPANQIDLGFGAPMSEWQDLPWAGMAEEPAPNTHQLRTRDATTTQRGGAGASHRPPQPKAKGWCLAHHFRRTFNKPSSAPPEKLRTDAEQIPNKSGKI